MMQTVNRTLQQKTNPTGESGNGGNLGEGNGPRNGSMEDRWRRLEIPIFSGEDAYGHTWEEFRTAIIRRFQPSMTQNPYELLLGLKQSSSVEDYREKFELYAGPLKGTDPDYLKGIFLNGLKDVIKAELKLYKVESLPELMDYAQRIDEKNKVINNGEGWSDKGGNRPRSYQPARTVTWNGGSNAAEGNHPVGGASSAGVAYQPRNHGLERRNNLVQN
ncbi:Retrotransposon gag domain [Sesbania bispinosa]|nr:Retrotransposon gag domain [Sesbania bispinosa]